MSVKFRYYAYSPMSLRSKKQFEKKFNSRYALGIRTLIFMSDLVIYLPSL